MADDNTKPDAGFSFDHESTNPEYERWLPTWQKLRDCYDGDEAIKEAGEDYLMKPEGMNSAPDPSKAFAAYLQRAEVPDLMAPTVRGLAGVIHRKPATYELPGGMTGLEETANLLGQPLDTLHRRITREVLKRGRFGILVDPPQDGGLPYLAGYTAEAIVDWDVNNQGKLEWLVLDEATDERNTEGKWVHIRRWRICRLVEGVYEQSVWELTGEGKDEKPTMVSRIVPTARNSSTLDQIPFVFINTNDLAPEPDEAPLYGVAKAQLAIYRIDADYRLALFLTAQPTPVAIGVDDAETAPKFIGSSAIWALPLGGDAKMLEFQGAGIQAMRLAMEDEYRRAVMAGASLLSNEQGEAESGEALRIRRASQTATITSIAQNTASGLEAALRLGGLFLGIDGKTIVVKPNLDFVESRMSPQEKTALIEAWLKGAISRKTMFWNLQRGEVIPDDRTFEEETADIEAEAPGLGLLGLEGVPSNDDDVVDEPDDTGTRQA